MLLSMLNHLSELYLYFFVLFINILLRFDIFSFIFQKNFFCFVADVSLMYIILYGHDQQLMYLHRLL